MKKSKILVPALGILCLTAAASVSGTLAWFTASQTVSLDGGNFVAVNPSTGLEIEISAGENTTSPNTKQTINVKDDLRFRDASVDVKQATASSAYSATVYKSVMGTDGFGSAPTSFATVDKDTDHYKFNTNVIYAATWSVQFKATGDSSINYDLYFGASSSTFTYDTGIAPAFRMAMYSKEDKDASDDKLIVWAPKRLDATVEHVNGTTTTSKANYNNVRTESVPGSTVTKDAGQAQKNFMGTIAGKSTMDFNFIVWFEGCDATCVSSTTIAADKIGAIALSFSIVSQLDGYKKATV